ncbi:MAG: NUDIX domain-containing protein [bacterium]
MAVIKKDKSIGIILFYAFPRSTKFLILKHRKGHWSFAKGHKDKGETPIRTACRELLEEAGIDDIKFSSKKILFSESYVYSNRNKEKILKSVDYFLAESFTKKVKIDKKEITNYRWCTIKAAEKIITFNESKKLLRKASRWLNKNFNKKK